MTPKSKHTPTSSDLMIVKDQDWVFRLQCFFFFFFFLVFWHGQSAMVQRATYRYQTQTFNRMNIGHYVPLCQPYVNMYTQLKRACSRSQLLLKCCVEELNMYCVDSNRIQSKLPQFEDYYLSNGNVCTFFHEHSNNARGILLRQ